MTPSPAPAPLPPPAMGEADFYSARGLPPVRARDMILAGCEALARLRDRSGPRPTLPPPLPSR